VLGKTFGCKTKKIKEGSEKLRNEDVHYLNSSPNVLVIKSRRLRWTRHVVRAREKRKSSEFRPENPKERWHLVEEGSDGKIALKFV
jgi:hypothetical protein